MSQNKRQFHEMREDAHHRQQLRERPELLDKLLSLEGDRKRAALTTEKQDLKPRESYPF